MKSVGQDKGSHKPVYTTTVLVNNCGEGWVGTWDFVLNVPLFLYSKHMLYEDIGIRQSSLKKLYACRLPHTLFSLAE